MKVKAYTKEYLEVELDQNTVESLFMTHDMSLRTIINKLQETFISTIRKKETDDTFCFKDGKFYTLDMGGTYDDIYYRDPTPTEQEFLDTIEELRKSIFVIELS